MEHLPNEIKNIIKDFIIINPINKNKLKEAVDLWCENKQEALNVYGHISNWNTSLITNMSELFQNKNDFNDNINNWDVSLVTNMECMFNGQNHLINPLIHGMYHQLLI